MWHAHLGEKICPYGPPGQGGMSIRARLQARLGHLGEVACPYGRDRMPFWATWAMWHAHQTEVV